MFGKTQTRQIRVTAGKPVHLGIGPRVNLGGQAERWRDLCTSLDVCDRKLVKLLPDT